MKNSKVKTSLCRDHGAHDNHDDRDIAIMMPSFPVTIVENNALA